MMTASCPAPPYLIDTQGLPWICVGFEFDVTGIRGETLTMTVRKLDLEWDIGEADDGFWSVGLQRIDGKWHWDGCLMQLELEEKVNFGEVNPNI